MLVGISPTPPAAISLKDAQLIADPPAAIGGSIGMNAFSIAISQSILNSFGASGGSIALGSSITQSLSLDSGTSLTLGSGAVQNFTVGPGGVLSNAATITVNGVTINANPPVPAALQPPIVALAQPTTQIILTQTLTQTPISDEPKATPQPTSPTAQLAISSQASTNLGMLALNLDTSTGFSGITATADQGLNLTVQNTPAAGSKVEAYKEFVVPEDKTRKDKDATAESAPASKYIDEAKSEQSIKAIAAIADSQINPAIQALFSDAGRAITSQTFMTAVSVEAPIASPVQGFGGQQGSSGAQFSAAAPGAATQNGPSVTTLPVSNVREDFARSNSQVQQETARKLGLGDAIQASPPTIEQIQKGLSNITQWIRNLRPGGQ